jgi:hypothetical protein
MSSSATQGPTEVRRRHQEGVSLIITIALTGALALLVVASLAWARSATQQSAHQGREDIALQAADAGVSRYVSRLVEDPRYYDHWVDQAEDPRIDSSGVVHQPGTAWTSGQSWTYAPGPSKTWTQLQDARFGKAAYSLRIQPPATAGSDTVTIQSTAQVGRGAPSPVTRSVQSQVRPESIADYQMISNTSIKYGSTATTTGKLYSAQDINHQGTALAPVYAAHYVCSSNYTTCPGSNQPSSVFKAKAYDSTTTPAFKDQFKTPIDFGQFTQARLDIKDAATANGTAFNDPTASAWEVQFLSNGTAKVFKITGTPDPGSSISKTGIGCPTTISTPPVTPTYLYFEQSVIVSDANSSQWRDSCGSTVGPRPSVVDGRITVATKGNVYIGGNITYEKPGDDVLGLIAAQDVIITNYTPSNLTWRAASLAQSGQWRTNRDQPDGNHASMTYIGSQTTYGGGYASMFDDRNYQYDDTLLYQRPPLYPLISGSWNTVYWHEVLPPG